MTDEDDAPMDPEDCGFYSVLVEHALRASFALRDRMRFREVTEDADGKRRVAVVP